MSARARYDAIVIGGGVNGLTCAAMLARRRAHAAARAARRGRRLRSRRRDRSRLQRADAGACDRAGPPRCGRRPAALSARPDVSRHARSRSAASRLTGGRWRCGTTRARPPRASAAWSAKDAHAGRRFTSRSARLGGLIGSLFQQRAAVDRRAQRARRVRADAHAVGLPSAAQGRPVAPAAMGTDGGRRPGERVGRDRAAAGDAGRGWHFRRDAGPVVGRQRPAVAAVGGQSVAGVAGRPGGRRRAGRVRARAAPRGRAARRRDPDRRGGRADRR